MLVGRIIETEASFLDSGSGPEPDPFFGRDDALALGREADLALADFLGAAPYLYGAQEAAGFFSDAIDAIGEAVTDVATSIGDRALDALKVVGTVIQTIAGPVLGTAQTFLDRVRSWGGNAAEWIVRTGDSIARGLAEYGGDLDKWLRSVPVIAQIYDGIRAANRITTQVFTLVPRLATVVIRGEDLGSFIASEYKAFGANVGAVAEFAALVSSFVPGIGQLTGPALALCAGLLEGKDLSSALVGAVCATLPGGQLVQAGAQFGARVGVALLSGQRIDRAALASLKEALPKSARAAFVASIEIAQGGSLEAALQKAVAEGLPIEELLKKIGVEGSALGDFADAIRFKSFPDPIRDLAAVLRDAGGTVLDQVNLKVPRFPSFGEAEALLLKVGKSPQDPKAIGEAIVAIAAYGGARVEVFNPRVLPLTIEPRLSSLLEAVTKDAGAVLAIGDRVFDGSEFLKQSSELREAVYAAARAAAKVSKPGDTSLAELSVAAAYNAIASREVEQTMLGGAMRIELNAGVVVVIGKTKGVPPVIDRVRQNAKLVAGGGALRLIQEGKIKLAIKAEAATPAARGPSAVMLRFEEGAAYVAPQVRPFVEALNAPTVIPSIKSQVSTVAPKAAAPMKAFASFQKSIPQAQGIPMRAYWQNPMREAQGIDPSNRAVYITEAGDSPIRIAKKVVGDGNRWRELVLANPSKPVKPSGADKGNFVSLRVGERLNLPKSWEPAVEKGVTPSGQVVQPVIVVPGPVVVPAPATQPDTTPNVIPTPGPSPTRIVPSDPNVAPPEVVKVGPAPVPVGPVSVAGGMGGMGAAYALGAAAVVGFLVFGGKKRKSA